jgi:FixJ family two-component response regulator
LPPPWTDFSDGARPENATSQKAATARIELSFRVGLGCVLADKSGKSLQHRNIVLVVDDDPGVLKGVQRLLRAHAYEPILFSSAEDFKNQTDFDTAVCVILDINLNDGSGIELRRGLKAAGVSVPVIYMTGNDDPAVRTAALASHCIAFLTKPFSVQELIEPLNSVVGHPKSGAQ